MQPETGGRTSHGGSASCRSVWRSLDAQARLSSIHFQCRQVHTQAPQAEIEIGCLEKKERWSDDVIKDNGVGST